MLHILSSFMNCLISMHTYMKRFDHDVSRFLSQRMWVTDELYDVFVCLFELTWNCCCYLTWRGLALHPRELPRRPALCMRVCMCVSSLLTHSAYRTHMTVLRAILNADQIKIAPCSAFQQTTSPLDTRRCNTDVYFHRVSRASTPARTTWCRSMIDSLCFGTLATKCAIPQGIALFSIHKIHHVRMFIQMSLCFHESVSIVMLLSMWTCATRHTSLTAASESDTALPKLSRRPTSMLLSSMLSWVENRHCTRT